MYSVVGKVKGTRQDYERSWGSNVLFYNGVVEVGLIQKMTFGKRLKGSEQVSDVGTAGRSFQGYETALRRNA